MKNQIIVLLLLTVTVVAQGSDWPQWRGPTRDGLVAGTVWPASITANELKPSWRVELSPSYSGPIVAGDLVVTTETVDKKYERVRAFHRRTGKEAWQHQWEGAMSVPFFAKANGSWIRSTPACDGERLYIAGMRDVLVCLDVASGEPKWRMDFMKEMKSPLPTFGFVCSPLIDGNAVYAQAGGAVVKLDKQTGRVIWQALGDKGGMMGSAFSSPVIASLHGDRQLVVQTRTTIAGVSLDDGRTLWQQDVKAFRGMNILTPVVHGDSVFTSTYGGKTILYDIQKSDGAYTVAPRWEYKSQGYMSTPVVLNGVAYHHLRSERMLAIDLDKGEEKWTTSMRFGKYCSLVAQGDRILVLDQNGTLHLVRANPQSFDLIGSRKVSEAETWAHLAVSNGQLFIRELKALAAWNWSEPTALNSGR